MAEFEDFAEYSSYEYVEEESNQEQPFPDIDALPDDIFNDDSQLFHHFQQPEEDVKESLTPPPEPVYPDNSTAFCLSLNQSRKLLHESFGISASSLRYKPVPGLVILPLKDYNLIRKDDRHNRTLPHIIIIPNDENFNVAHPECAQFIQILNN